MTTETVVELKELTVRYGRMTAVDRLSLEVAKGSVYALLGRNGSGKSSTVRCLLGQRRASAGIARRLRSRCLEGTATDHGAGGGGAGAAGHTS